MRVLSPFFVEAFKHRILNIHPSLLPLFPGLDAQRQALEHGAKLSGCTVHYVDNTLDGEKELLGLWLSESEGAKFWLTVFTELKNRGVQDCFIACVDGLQGLPEAIEAGVAFMPGEPFFPVTVENSGRLRLNFSHASEEQADVGLVEAAVQQGVDGVLQVLSLVEHGDGLGAGLGGAGRVGHGSSIR